LVAVVEDMLEKVKVLLHTGCFYAAKIGIFSNIVYVHLL
jgi:hypothetical protein